ncbi:hypothetical protein L7F22_028712 [Adiantum nelumboides]|nr:hypothetical protein [Adiantum nelumboides]
MPESIEVGNLKVIVDEKLEDLEDKKGTAELLEEKAELNPVMTHKSVVEDSALALLSAYALSFAGGQFLRHRGSITDQGIVNLYRVDSCSSVPSSGSLVTDTANGEDFNLVVRSGVYFDVGPRRVMEDEHVRIDDLVDYLGSLSMKKGLTSCYGVFDGHGGKDAAQFARDMLLKYIVQDVSFPASVEQAVYQGFLKTDKAFAEACRADNSLSSGTTAIMVLVLGREVFVANAGDCRAVLCRGGKAVDMSRDHKPWCQQERIRIEALGGYIDDGYLNGQLGVARALGDWHMDGLKGAGCPLSGEPEVKHFILTADDEFLIIGCDGLWDVLTSQLAVEFARKRLQQHNDPEQCCRELVAEALRRESSDNLTVVVVCLQANAPPKLPTNLRVRKSISSQGLQHLQGALDSIF